MVGGSDLAFRLLCRRHGADIAYTEMLFAERLLYEPAYLQTRLRTCAADHPLVVQLAANSPTMLAAAAKLVEPMCEAVDLNLGCPLPAAAAAPFGAWLLDRHHWPLVESMVAATVSAVSIPVCCKIRLLPSNAETVELCQRLEAAGCSLLTVHGRQRPVEPRASTRDWACEADLAAVRAVARAVSIPVISNGNTDFYSDVEINLELTGCAGVMSAAGLLRNPRLFSCGEELTRRELGQVAMEYLDLAEAYPPPHFSWVRGHLMWMMGREGKGHRCHFSSESLGPFSAAQLLCALQEAADIETCKGIVLATLLAP